jgi:FkbM family methyltransferase
VLFDCGANIGQTAANLRQAYPHAELYCFEPTRGSLETLKRTAASLNAHAVPLAVGDVNGPADMFLTPSSQSSSLLGYLDRDNPLADAHRVIGTECVRVCRLDDFCDENGIETHRVDVLKMDVQGGELEALRGATRILRTVRIVLLEVAFVAFYRDAPLFEAIESLMRERGFERRWLYGSVRPDLWGDALYVPA